MPSFKHAALVATAIAAFAPGTAWADAVCPGPPSDRFPDTPPMPTITSYTVTRSTAPDSERESGNHEAMVIGGDAVEGEMRIDIRLSRDLPRDCPLSVGIIDPAAPASDRRLGGGDVMKVFRIMESDRVQVMALQRPDTGYVTPLLYGDGTNRLVLRAKTRGQFGDHTAQLALQIRYEGQLYPFTLVRRGLPDMVASLSSPVTRFGSTVEVVAALPFNPGTGAIDDKVTFAVKPPEAGNFRRPNDVRNLQPTVVDPLDADLNPRRATVIFVPSGVPKTTNAVITATLMGRIKSLPITIRPVPTPCKPSGTWDVIKGGLTLTLTNQGELPCPELIVSLDAAPLSPQGTLRTSRIFASPEAPDAPAFGNRMLLRPTPTPPPSSPSEPTSWTGTFMIGGPYPAGGFNVTATLRPSDHSFPAVVLERFPVTAVSIAKGR